MGDTIREKILQNLETTLEGITVAGGYNNTVASVQRWKQRGNTVKSTPCIIISAGTESKSYAANPLSTCLFSVMLDLWIVDNENSTDPTDKVLNSYLGDIEKILNVDRMRGGYAVDTAIMRSTPFETVEGQPYAGLVIELQILYRHYQNNPELQA